MAAAGREDPTPTPLARLANPIEFQVLPSRRSKARPVAAPVPQRYVRPGVAATVIDEDTYVSALDHIIEREFFPDLPQLQQQLRWLETVDSGDAARIEQMRHELVAAVRRTDTFAKASTPAEPPSATPLPAFAAGAAGTAAAAARRGRMMEGLDLALGGSRALFAMGSATPLRRGPADDDDAEAGSSSATAVSGRKRARPTDAGSRAGADDTGSVEGSADPWAAGVPSRQTADPPGEAAAEASDGSVVASRRKRRRLSHSAASAALSAAAGARRRASGSGVDAADDASIHDDGGVDEDDGSDPAAATARRAARAAGSMSLGAFQATFTSEDNASFGRNQDQTLQAHRRKYWWLHERVDARKRRLMLVDGNASRAVGLLGPMTDDNLSTSGSKFIEDMAAMGGDTRGVLPMWTYRPMNSLFFPPDLASTSAVSGVARPTLHPHLRVAEVQAAEAHKLLTDTDAVDAAKTAQQQQLLLGDAPAPALLTDGTVAPPTSTALVAANAPGGALVAADGPAALTSSSALAAAPPTAPVVALAIAETANAAHRISAPLGAGGTAAGRASAIAAAAAAARQQLIVRNSLPHPSLTDVVTVGSVDVFLPSGHRIRRSDGGIVAPPQLRSSRTRFNHEQVHAALRAPDAAAVATQAAVANAVLAAAVSAGTIVPPSPKINGYGFLATPLLESLPLPPLAPPPVVADAAAPSMSQRDAINAIRAASGLAVPSGASATPPVAPAGKAARSSGGSAVGGQYKLLEDPRAAGSRSTTIRASEVASIVDPVAMAAAEASAPAFQVNPAVHAEEVAARLLDEKRRKMKSTRTTVVAVAALKRAGYDAGGGIGMVDAPLSPALSSSASAAGGSSVITRGRPSGGSGASAVGPGGGAWPLTGTLPMGTPVFAAGTPAALSVAARQRAAAGSVLAGGIGASVAGKSHRSSATSASVHPAVRAAASLSPAARALALSVARKSAASGGSPGAGGSPFGGVR